MYKTIELTVVDDYGTVFKQFNFFNFHLYMSWITADG